MTLQDAVQNDKSIKWVRNCTDVQEVIKCIQGVSIIAVDAEYHDGKIVLLQIFTGQFTLLFDFVVEDNHRNELVSCLKQIMHDSSICKVFQDSRKDVLYLHDMGITKCAAICDTQVLHQLNMDLKNIKDKRIGLGKLLQEHQLEHKLKAQIHQNMNKGSVNWSARTLSEELIRYATEDVVYLIQLYHSLEVQRKKFTQAICDSYSTSKLEDNTSNRPGNDSTAVPPKKSFTKRDDWLYFHKH
jgi:ribonuclease D